jgi:transcription elongation factor GreB
VSRAFIDENESQYNDDQTPELKVPLPPGARNYVTPEGAEKLRRELAALSSEERPRIMAEITRASSVGSSTDKDALAGLRKRLREIDKRVEYLRRMAALMEVVDPRTQSPGRAAFGAVVTVSEQGGGEKAYRIVGVDESDPASGLVSWISPLARALVSRRAGDSVIVKLPAGEKSLTVLKIEYP